MIKPEFDLVFNFNSNGGMIFQGLPEYLSILDEYVKNYELEIYLSNRTCRGYSHFPIYNKFALAKDIIDYFRSLGYVVKSLYPENLLEEYALTTEDSSVE